MRVSHKRIDRFLSSSKTAKTASAYHPATSSARQCNKAPDIGSDQCDVNLLLSDSAKASAAVPESERRRDGLVQRCRHVYRRRLLERSQGCATAKRLNGTKIRDVLDKSPCDLDLLPISMPTAINRSLILSLRS